MRRSESCLDLVMKTEINIHDDNLSIEDYSTDGLQAEMLKVVFMQYCETEEQQLR